MMRLVGLSVAVFLAVYGLGWQGYGASAAVAMRLVGLSVAVYLAVCRLGWQGYGASAAVALLAYAYPSIPALALFLHLVLAGAMHAGEKQAERAFGPVDFDDVHARVHGADGQRARFTPAELAGEWWMAASTDPAVSDTPCMRADWSVEEG